MDVLDADISINDEATANVAPENEADLMNAVEELTKEKTIIMIAHRLKTVRKADQILVIEKGRIAEQGTHDVLLQKNGIYSSFICSRKQFFICFIWIRDVVQSFLVCYFNGEDLKIRHNSFTISFNSCISSGYRSPVLFTFFAI